MNDLTPRISAFVGQEGEGKVYLEGFIGGEVSGLGLHASASRVVGLSFPWVMYLGKMSNLPWKISTSTHTKITFCFREVMGPLKSIYKFPSAP